MALNFGQNFFVPSQELLQNFDYADIADGIGYVIYFGGLGNNGTPFVTRSSQMYSEFIKTIVLTTQGTTKFFEKDFDIDFNLPRNILGKIICAIPMGAVHALADAFADVDLHAVCTAFHVTSGGSETQLATATSTTHDITQLKAQNGGSQGVMATCVLDVTTIKHFKKGETLRITVEGHEAAADNDSILVAVGHDPANRSDTREEDNSSSGSVCFYSQYDAGTAGSANLVRVSRPTQMAFHVPFRLDI